MSFDPEYQRDIEGLKNKIDAIIDIDLGDLLRSGEDLGQFTPREAVKYLEQVQEAIRLLKIEEAPRLNDGDKREIEIIAQKFQNEITAVQSLYKNQSNAHILRDSLTNRCGSLANEVSTKLPIILSSRAAFKVSFFRDSIEAIQARLADVDAVRADFENINSKLEEAIQRSEKAADEFRRISGQSGITEQAKHFERAENFYAASAQKSLRWLIGLSVALIFFAILSAFFHELPKLAAESPFEAAQLIFAKFLIFVVLTFGLAIATRNYQSSRHNEVVNRHRKDALSTYEALMIAGSTPEARDIILNHAASAIYSLHDTGFAKSKDLAPTNLTPLFAMLSRQAGPSGGGS